MTFQTKSARFGCGAAQGVPGIATVFDKFAAYEGEVTPHMVGFKVEDSDGNVYRFSHFGADVNRGVLVAQDLSESSLGDSDNVIAAAASAGATSLTITAGDAGSIVNENQYAGGKLIISDDTGEGYTYDILGNTRNATTGSAITVYLKQPLAAALATTSDFIIVGNKYANLEIATNGTDCCLAGVTCRTMDVSDKSYGWVQTKGIVGILCDGSDVVGENISLSDGVNGAVQCSSNDGIASLDQIIGSCVVAGDSTGHGAYYINVD